MKKYGHNFVDKVHEDFNKLVYRKFFMIEDSKTRKYVSSEGIIPLFYKSREARNFIRKHQLVNPKAVTWKVIRVQADVTRL